MNLPKFSGHREKWAAVLLGVVCLVLLINLAQSSKPVRAGGGTRTPGKPAPNMAHSKPPAPHGAVADADPGVQLDRLQAFDSRPLPEFVRNPFEFEPVRPDPRTVRDQSQPTAPPPPPAPPPLPIKALGYAERAGGVREAYLTADDQEVFVVHAGESFGGRFRVLAIDPQKVEIQDETSHQTGQFTFPE